MRDDFSKILQQREHSPFPVKDFLPAGVLVPLFVKNDAFQVLFTQRSMTVRDHKGQISFPGGMYESHDQDLLATALRETEEELGIPSAKVEVVGRLSELITPTGYHITPYVGIIPHGIVYRLNEEEISGIIEVPLEHLLAPQNMRLERGEFFNRQTEMPYFEYEQHVIWGATGRITRELVELTLEYRKKQGIETPHN